MKKVLLCLALLGFHIGFGQSEKCPDFTHEYHERIFTTRITESGVDVYGTDHCYVIEKFDGTELYYLYTPIEVMPLDVGENVLRALFGSQASITPDPSLDG